MTVNLWLFPRDDFAAWQAMVGVGDTENYDGYLTLLAAMQADQERAGHTVRRIRMTVAEMRRRLDASGWRNTADRRAAVLAMAAI